MITGCTNGIGLATARAVVAADHHLIMAVRDTHRGHELRHELATTTRNTNIEVIECNLASRSSIDTCADRILQRYPALDVLINNAGTMLRKPRLSESGFELTFATNHLGPFQLTNRLLPSLAAAQLGRVVTVASAAHMRGVMDFDHLRGLHNYSMMRAYSRSKLANVMFSMALARRLEASSVRVNCLHPGIIGSNILPNDTLPWRVLGHLAKLLGLMASVEDGAATSLYLALSEAAADMQGLYLDEHQIPQLCSTQALSASLQERLWGLCAAATGTG
jgi:NAD(P)-dependent dehydrogenase (short-subunit alcohol dehydrogenase family)